MREFQWSENFVSIRSKAAQRSESGIAISVCNVDVIRGKLVEPMGFEPTASSMPSRRAPNCATAPPKAIIGSHFYTTWNTKRQTKGAESISSHCALCLCR
jgi:hypothetical protein